jgi:hypothetical protein
VGVYTHNAYGRVIRCGISILDDQVEQDWVWKDRKSHTIRLIETLIRIRDVRRGRWCGRERIKASRENWSWSLESFGWAHIENKRLDEDHCLHIHSSTCQARSSSYWSEAWCISYIFELVMTDWDRYSWEDTRGISDGSWAKEWWCSRWWVENHTCLVVHLVAQLDSLINCLTSGWHSNGEGYLDEVEEDLCWDWKLH